MATSRLFYQPATTKGSSSRSGLEFPSPRRPSEHELREAKGTPVISRKYSHLGWGILTGVDLNFEGHFEYQSSYRTEPIIDDLENIVFGGQFIADFPVISAVIKLNGEHMPARIVEGKVTDRGLALVEINDKTDPTWLAPPYLSGSGETMQWTDREFSYYPTNSFSMKLQQVALQSFLLHSGQFSYWDLADDSCIAPISVVPTNFQTPS